MTRVTLELSDEVVEAVRRWTDEDEPLAHCVFDLMWIGYLTASGKHEAAQSRLAVRREPTGRG